MKAGKICKERTAKAAIFSEPMSTIMGRMTESRQWRREYLTRTVKKEMNRGKGKGSVRMGTGEGN